MKKIYILLLLICLSCQIKAQTLFCDDFENGNNGWIATSASGSVWQQDTFSIGLTPNHVWDIGLYTNYVPSSFAFLYTPVINLSSSLSLSLCFWQQFSTELYQDGTRMDYSTDGGLTWQVLGTGGSVTWYNAYFIISSGNLPGWTGNNSIWTEASYSLGTIASGTIQFRFVFTSDSIISSGFHMIDNFCLCDAATCNCSSTVGIAKSSYTDKSLTIFPNPSSTEFQISNFSFQTNDEIILRDALGKIYFTKKISSPTSNLKLQTLNFSNGIYFLEVNTKEGALNKKVVVEH